MSGSGARGRAARALLAADVALWLCALPVRWRRGSLSSFLERLAPAGARGRGAAMDVDVAVAVVLRVCRLGVFSLPVYPRVCLREACALYWVLRRMGHPARFRLGVRKDGDALVAHSWVTLHGRPVPPWEGEALFSPVYSYPPAGPESRQLTGHGALRGPASREGAR